MHRTIFYWLCFTVYCILTFSETNSKVIQTCSRGNNYFDVLLLKMCNCCPCINMCYFMRDDYIVVDIFVGCFGTLWNMGFHVDIVSLNRPDEKCCWKKSRNITPFCATFLILILLHKSWNLDFEMPNIFVVDKNWFQVSELIIKLFRMLRYHKCSRYFICRFGI